MVLHPPFVVGGRTTRTLPLSRKLEYMFEMVLSA